MARALLWLLALYNLAVCDASSHFGHHAAHHHKRAVAVGRLGGLQPARHGLTPLRNPSNLAPGSYGVSQGCYFFVTAQPGDYCALYVSEYNIESLGEFYLWNPSVNSDCTNLLAGTAYCIRGPDISVPAVASPPPPPPPAPAPAPAPATGQLYTGDATWFEAGLGACGTTVNGNTAFIVAMSHLLYDTYEGGWASTGNPNLAPICGKRIRVFYESFHVDVTVQDRCEGCAYFSVDLSVIAFEQLAPLSVGRMVVNWEWL